MDRIHSEASGIQLHPNNTDMSAEIQHCKSHQRESLLRNGHANTPTARRCRNKHLSATTVTSRNSKGCCWRWFLLGPYRGHITRTRCHYKKILTLGSRAVAQAVSRWLPIAEARVRVRAACGVLWWTKRHWGRFPPSTSVSPRNHHSINFSIIIITRGWHNRPISGRSAEWTQLDTTPH
jgi:hypothetical protein